MSSFKGFDTFTKWWNDFFNTDNWRQGNKPDYNPSFAEYVTDRLDQTTPFPDGITPTNTDVPSYTNTNSSDYNGLYSLLTKGSMALGNLRYYSSGAARQNQFSKEMADTTIQRGKTDLEAAGYNPILAAGSGGLSAPSANSSSGVSSSPGFIGSLLTGIARIVGTSIYASAMDNRTLTMANSASAVNTAKALYYDSMRSKHQTEDVLNFTKEDYYRQLADKEKWFNDHRAKNYEDWYDKATRYEK